MSALTVCTSGLVTLVSSLTQVSWTQMCTLELFVPGELQTIERWDATSSLNKIVTLDFRLQDQGKGS